MNLNKIKNRGNKKKSGFTLIEVVIAIGIIAILFTIGTKPFVAMKNRRALDDSVGRVESVLQEARSMTVSSVGASRYGVHFEETRTVLFRGSVYSPSSLDNKVVNLNSSVLISEVNLAGEGLDVVFNRLNGETDNPGTIKLNLVSDPTKFKLITIFSGGTFFSD